MQPRCRVRCRTSPGSCPDGRGCGRVPRRRASSACCGRWRADPRGRGPTPLPRPATHWARPRVRSPYPQATVTTVAVVEFQYDRFLVDQLLRAIANLYRVTPLAAGEAPAGPPIAYVRQKKLALKEDIRFYADEGETRELFRIA